MEQYIKDQHIINATQKAYETIYKDRGYVPYVEKGEEADSISKMEKDDLIKIAVEKGIEVPENTTKDAIIMLIKEVEEKEGADE